MSEESHISSLPLQTAFNMDKKFNKTIKKTETEFQKLLARESPKKVDNKLFRDQWPFNIIKFCACSWNLESEADTLVPYIPKEDEIYNSNLVLNNNIEQLFSEKNLQIVNNQLINNRIQQKPLFTLPYYYQPLDKDFQPNQHFKSYSVDFENNKILKQSKDNRHNDEMGISYLEIAYDPLNSLKGDVDSPLSFPSSSPLPDNVKKVVDTNFLGRLKRFAKFSNLAYCQNMDVDLQDFQAKIMKDKEAKEIILYFRGNEALWYQQLILLPSYTKYPRASINSSKDISFGRRVDKYLYETWANSVDILMFYLSGIIKEYPDYKICLTGHGYGGAFAEFTAIHFIENSSSMTNKIPVEVYTYSSPRIGDMIFGKYNCANSAKSLQGENHKGPFLGVMMGKCDGDD
ncbi:hypothetical protein G9A89_015071 [Geosiphon pyriformis]|nr:hypothetical protein G9A89_015071 [Geosiphon pyriformis]